MWHVGAPRRDLPFAIRALRSFDRACRWVCCGNAAPTVQPGRSRCGAPGAPLRSRWLEAKMGSLGPAEQPGDHTRSRPVAGTRTDRRLSTEPALALREHRSERRSHAHLPAPYVVPLARTGASMHAARLLATSLHAPRDCAAAAAPGPARCRSTWAAAATSPAITATSRPDRSSDRGSMDEATADRVL